MNRLKIYLTSGLLLTFLGLHATPPVTISNYALYQWGEDAIFEWTTSQEVNHSHFEIQVTVDGLPFGNWNNIPGAGNSAQPLQYSLTIPDPGPGFLCVQLITVDFDGYYAFLIPQCLHINSDTTMVWPGDANADGFANAWDVPYVGAAYGAAGFARQNASSAWTPQYSPPWPTPPTVTPNHKFADCDGDGIVNNADLLPILLNYDKSHGPPVPLPLELLPPPPVTLDYPDSVAGGDTVHIDLLVGTPNDTLAGIYGLALALAYDTADVKFGSVSVQIDSSWLGDPATDLISLDQNLWNDGRVEIGVSRNDGVERQGAGRIGGVTIVMVDDLAKRAAGVPLTVHLVRPQVFDRHAALIEWPAGNKHALASSLEADPVFLYPNPAAETLTIVMADFIMTGAAIYTPQGRIVRNFSGWDHRWTAELQVRDLAPGLYYLCVETSAGPFLKKFLKQ